MGLRIYTGGTFDLFHSGHVQFLEMCKRIAGLDGAVIVSLNSDEFIAAYKGKPPVMSYNERWEVLNACRHVDSIIMNTGGGDSTFAISDTRPDMIVIGSDWARKDYYKQMGFTQDWLDVEGISLCYIPYTQGISSTDIKARLKVN